MFCMTWQREVPRFIPDGSSGGGEEPSGNGDTPEEYQRKLAHTFAIVLRNYFSNKNDSEAAEAIESAAMMTLHFLECLGMVKLLEPELRPYAELLKDLDEYDRLDGVAIANAYIHKCETVSLDSQPIVPPPGTEFDN